jgi:hypothetical protein
MQSHPIATRYSCSDKNIRYTSVQHRVGVCARETAHVISNDRLGIMAGETTRLLVSYTWEAATDKFGGCVTCRQRKVSLNIKGLPDMESDEPVGQM